MPSKPGSRTHGVTFTFFQDDSGSDATRTFQWFDDNIKKCGADYGIYGLETCPTSGRRHYQGYLHFKHAKSYAPLARTYSMQCQSAVAGPDSNFVYCAKDHVITEWGVFPSPGVRNDLASLDQLSRQGSSRPCATVGGSLSSQARKHFQNLLSHNEPGRSWMPACFWFFGPTGTGKSHNARSFLKAQGANDDDIYVLNPAMKGYWEGYDSHEYVIIDDLRPDQISYSEILRIFDKYPHRVNQKFGSRQLRFKYAVVTSSLSIQHFTPPEEDFKQLARRFVQKLFSHRYVSSEISDFRAHNKLLLSTFLEKCHLSDVPVDLLNVPERPLNEDLNVDICEEET